MIVPPLSYSLLITILLLIIIASRYICTGDTVVSNSGTPSSGTSGSSPLSVTVTTSGSSPVSGPAAGDAALPVQPAGSTPKRQTLKELLASIPGFSLRVSKCHCYTL